MHRGGGPDGGGAARLAPAACALGALRRIPAGRAPAACPGIAATCRRRRRAGGRCSAAVGRSHAQLAAIQWRCCMAGLPAAAAPHSRPCVSGPQRTPVWGGVRYRYWYSSVASTALQRGAAVVQPWRARRQQVPLKARTCMTRHLASWSNAAACNSVAPTDPGGAPSSWPLLAG